MKRWQKITIGIVGGFIALIVLFAIIGKSKTNTVTKTVTVTTASKPVTKTPASCIRAILLMTQALTTLNNASVSYSRLILPSYKEGARGGDASVVVAAENRATAKVNRATSIVKQATPFATACRKG